MWSRSYRGTIENFGRAPGARGIFMVPPYRRIPFQQEVEPYPPEAAGASGFATSAFMDPPWGGARRLVGSFGDSVGPDHVKPASLPFSPMSLSTRAWRHV